MRDVPIESDKIEGNHGLTLGDSIDISQNVIRPFLLAAQLNGESLINARLNFLEAIVKPFDETIGRLSEVSYQCEQLDDQQLLFLSQRVEANDNLDQNYKILALDALNRYKQAILKEDKDRVLDDFLCYALGRVPLEPVETPPIENVQKCNAQTVLKIANIVRRAAMPLALLAGPVGLIYTLASVSIDCCIACPKICNLFAYIFNCNQSPEDQ